MICEKSLVFYIVRHGQSWGNIEDSPSFDYLKEDPPLTPLGRTQAQKLVNRFENCRIDKIYSSTLIRTVETAYPVAEKFGKNIIMIPALVEKSTNLGGLNPELIPGEYPLAVFSHDLSPAFSIRPYGHEESEEVQERAERVVREITAEAVDGECILISDHGTFYSYLCRALLGLNLSADFRWQVDNASVTVIRYEKGEKPKLCYMNDVRHLSPDEIT